MDCQAEIIKHKGDLYFAYLACNLTGESIFDFLCFSIPWLRLYNNTVSLVRLDSSNNKKLLALTRCFCDDLFTGCNKKMAPFPDKFTHF